MSVVRVLAVTVCLGFSMQAYSGVITSTLGNAVHGLTEGGVYTTDELEAVQSGSDPSFDGLKGEDSTIINTNFNETWTHSFGPVSGTIVSATLTFGIADHDSAILGNQVGGFSLDGADYTSDLNAAFETDRAGDGVFRMYSITLSDAELQDLLDGAFAVSLELEGMGLFPVNVNGTGAFALLSGTTAGNFAKPTISNGAHLIFSQLVINTTDRSGPNQPGVPGANAPIAPTWLLIGLGLGLMGYRRRRLSD